MLAVADLRIKQVRGNEFIELDEEEDDEDFVDAVNQTTVCWVDDISYFPSFVALWLRCCGSFYTFRWQAFDLQIDA